MSELPPLSGRPVAPAVVGDPWAEQARRHAQHRAEQRRRRQLVFARVAGAAGVLAAMGAAAFFIVDVDDSSDGTADVSGAESGRLAVDDVAPGGSVAIQVTSSTGSVPTEDAEQTAQVIDVWLLDRGEGNFDWGAVLSSNTDVVRGDLDVSAVALDDDGVELFAEQVTVPQLAPDSDAVVGGAFDVDDGTPTRMEVTATLGTALPDEVGAVFAVSDVRRVASGQVNRDDRLLGTVELVEGAEVTVRLAAMWRDDGGRVLAAVFDVLGPVDVDAAVEFSLRLPRNFVPPGEPDTIVASVGATE